MTITTGTQHSAPTRTAVRSGSPRPATSWLIGALPIAVMAILVVYPVLLLVGNAVEDSSGGFSVAEWSVLFQNPVFIDTILTTVRVAVIATIGCIVIGTFLAIVIAYVPFRGARVVTAALNVYLSFPSFLITLALVFIWGNVGIVNGAIDAATGGSAPPLHLLDSQWGVILAEVTYFTPFVVRPVLSALEVMDRSQVEVAESLGAGPTRIVGTLILPEVAPALLAGGALVLMRTMNEFGIVLFAGAKDVTTLPTLVYSQAISRGNYQVAAIAALVNIVLSLGLYLLYRQITARALGGSRAR